MAFLNSSSLTKELHETQFLKFYTTIVVAHLSQFFRNNFPQFHRALLTILVTMLSLEGHFRKVLALLKQNYL